MPASVHVNPTAIAIRFSRETQPVTPAIRAW
jgi:hypothetical protein